MTTRHEAPKQKHIPEIHFMPEGFVDPNGPEFLDQLLERIRSSGVDTSDLVFSGTQAKKVFTPDGSIQRPQAIFGMNEAGWRDSMRRRDMTPGGFTEGDTDVPCIVLFDGRQLTQPQGYKLLQSIYDYHEAVKIVDIVPGDLKPLETKDLLEEVAIHVDYPNSSPADAIVGLVFIEEEAYGPVRDHGL